MYFELVLQKTLRWALGKNYGEVPGYVDARGGAREYANSRSRAKLLVALLPEHTTKRAHAVPLVSARQHPKNMYPAGGFLYLRVRGVTTGVPYLRKTRGPDLGNTKLLVEVHRGKSLCHHAKCPLISPAAPLQRASNQPTGFSSVAVVTPIAVVLAVATIPPLRAAAIFGGESRSRAHRPFVS